MANSWTTTTWSTLTPASGNLAAGIFPTNPSTVKEFAGTEGGTPDLLTDGAGSTSSAANWCAATGSVLYFMLPGICTINSINIYGAWSSSARSRITITEIAVNSSGAPSTFTALTNGSVDYASGGNQNLATFAPSSGSLATDVTMVRVTFGTQLNGYCGYTEIEFVGSQTGSGPNWNIWTVPKAGWSSFSAASSNLALGLTPTVSGNGSAGAESSGPVTVLTDGLNAADIAHKYTVGNNTIMVFALGGTFDITKINLWTNWSGRAALTITSIEAKIGGVYSTIGQSNLNKDAQIGSNYGSLAPCSWMAATKLATAVTDVRITFGTQQNGYVGYVEIEIVGAASGAADGAAVSRRRRRCSTLLTNSL